MVVNYYKIAIEWGEEYLRNNKEPKAMRWQPHSTITNDIEFVSTCVERLKSLPDGRIKQAEYELLRKFKQFIENVNKNVDIINKIV